MLNYVCSSIAKTVTYIGHCPSCTCLWADVQHDRLCRLNVLLFDDSFVFQLCSISVWKGLKIPLGAPVDVEMVGLTLGEWMSRGDDGGCLGECEGREGCVGGGEGRGGMAGREGYGERRE